MSEEQPMDKYPYSDTVAELREINRSLELITQQLSALVPRYYVEMPSIHTAKDKEIANKIGNIVRKFFEECPAGGVKAVSAKEAQVLSHHLKKVG